MMEAFIKVHSKKKCKLLLIGDGPERGRAEQMSRAAGIQQDVVLLGKQTGIIDLLGLADVYFIPSETESFGLSALEAMSCEVPVVGTDAGGFPEVVVDGECGYLTAVGDVEAMAARILHLLEHPDQAHAMGLAGRKRAQELFPIEKVVSQYEQIYRRVIH